MCCLSLSTGWLEIRGLAAVAQVPTCPRHGTGGLWPLQGGLCPSLFPNCCEVLLCCERLGWFSPHHLSWWMWAWGGAGMGWIAWAQGWKLEGREQGERGKRWSQKCSDRVELVSHCKNSGFHSKWDRSYCKILSRDRHTLISNFKA